MSFLTRIKKYAAKSYHRQYRHVCIVERGGAVQAVGYNTRGNTHAEVCALKHLWPSKRVGCKVWSLRMSVGGKLSMAKPCPDCEKFLRESGVKIVFYSDRDGSIQRLRLR